jgi:hypothetical protein
MRKFRTLEDHNQASPPARPVHKRRDGNYCATVRADEILVAVEASLRREHRRRRTVYRREWSIGVGATRVDLAAINGSITGCEVKSARDNFARLESQARLYSAVLDTAVLVVEGEAAATRASGIIPEWWGLWCASKVAEGVDLGVMRAPKPNPAPDALSVAQLLWRDEAYSVLARRDLAAGLRKATRWRLWQILAEQLPLAVLQREVREAIKARLDW